jgi:dihydroorotase
MALEAAKDAGLPLMVHIGTGTDIDAVATSLRRGNIITHCFTPSRPTIMDEQGRIRPSVVDAYVRGVLFDIGYDTRCFGLKLPRPPVRPA